MSLMTTRDESGPVTGVERARGEMLACVAVICLLASAPLFVAIALMVWGG